MQRSWRWFCGVCVVVVLGEASARATTISAFSAYAGFPASPEPVLLAAVVSADDGSPITAGSITFAVTQDGTAVGMPVMSAVTNGTASATFIVPEGTAPGSYTIDASYLPPEPGPEGPSDTTHTLTVSQAPALVRTTQLAAGSSGCPDGGVQIDSGLDNGANGGVALDGILEDGEVLSTSDVCNGMNGSDGTNGTPGPGALVQTVTLPVGNSICPNGGTQIDVGLDNGAHGGSAGDGVLQAGEVTSTVDLCNGTNGTNGVNGTNGAAGKNGCASAPVSALALAALLFRRRRAQ